MTDSAPISLQSPPPCRAIVDLSAIRKNYQFLNTISANAECAVVLKANAYGLGISKVAPELYCAGARTFFVAFLSEAIELKSTLGNTVQVKIYVLEGNSPGSESDFNQIQVAPVLNSVDQVKRWNEHQRKNKEVLPCALHIDTGMNRLGLSVSEVKWALESQDSEGVDLVISHFGSADSPQSQQSAKQLERFVSDSIQKPGLRYSIANSSGMFLGKPFLLDLVRPGASLFGIQPTRCKSNPMQPVITIEARLVQIRKIRAGEPVGYGATFISNKPMRLGTISMGYADGYPRSLSGSNAVAVFNGRKAPLVGRVSMDSIVVDLSDFSNQTPKEGDYLQLISNDFSLDELAVNANTIGNEILTGLGGRLKWKYLNRSGDTHSIYDC